MDIKDSFQLYNNKNTSENNLETFKLQEEVNEYVDRVKFSFISSGIYLLCGIYFLYIFVSLTGDLRFSFGFFLLGLISFGWFISIMLFLEKKKRLQQIITYSNYKCMPAKCTNVNQMNMIGIWYEFIMSESPFQRFQINALKMKNYVMDVREGDEVLIVQYFSTYYVVFSTVKPNNATVYNDIQSVLSLQHYNKKQRNIYLIGTAVGILLFMNIGYYMLKNATDFPIEIPLFIINFFATHLVILVYRTKK